MSVVESLSERGRRVFSLETRSASSSTAVDASGKIWLLVFVLDCSSADFLNLPLRQVYLPAQPDV
jgi:hypothetical protein